MPNRSKDWLRQAKSDLQHARISKNAGSYEWSCFAAQQSAEKAVKAVLLGAGKEAFGHSVLQLLNEVADTESVAEDLRDAARRLDRFYIPSRYPDGFPAGTPSDYFNKKDAKEGINDAEKIIEFCSDLFD